MPKIKSTVTSPSGEKFTRTSVKQPWGFAVFARHTRKEAGYGPKATEWGEPSCWCSRRDLAEKKAKAWLQPACNGRYEAVVVEAVIS